MAATYDATFAHLNTLMQPYLAPDQTVEPQSMLVDDLGLDSMQTMEVLMDMEDWLDVAIPMNLLPEVHTVDDLVRALTRLTA